MNQYEYRLTSKTTGINNRARATARSAQIARLHIARCYGHTFDVGVEPIAIRSAHEVIGEIDCNALGCDEVAA